MSAGNGECEAENSYQLCFRESFPAKALNSPTLFSKWRVDPLYGLSIDKEIAG